MPESALSTAGRGGHQSLPLAGLHLGDPPLVQDGAAEELHIEMAHSERAARRLPTHRERLRHQVVERLALSGAFAQFPGSAGERRILDFAQLGFERADLRHERAESLQLPLGLLADDLGEDVLEHDRMPAKRPNSNTGPIGQRPVPPPARARSQYGRVRRDRISRVRSPGFGGRAQKESPPPDPGRRR